MISKQILDLLEIEGTWWPVDEIADRLKVQPDTVKRSLYRAARRGTVAKRNEPLRFRIKEDIT